MSTLANKEDNAKQFYVADDPTISETAKNILTKYSHVPEEDLIKHIRNVRDSAWSTHPYPCLGRYAFLNFSIGSSPHYDDVVQRLKSSSDVNLIDIGCCFGQDLRRLVTDGIDSAQLYGSELETKFVELGYDLFRDKETLKATFTSEDFFGDASAASVLKPGHYDFVHAASFFHLFDWDESVQAVTRAVGLLKSRPGSMVFGRQVGISRPGAVKHFLAKTGAMYRHDEESLRGSFEEGLHNAGVKADINIWKGEVLQSSDEEGDVRYLSFSIVRV